MDLDQIPVISVSYNSAQLIEELLGSFRAFYSNPVYIIDGSGENEYRSIEAVCARYPNVRFIHFDYNIHHGPGMAWAFQNLELSGPVLVLDSDIVILKAGFLEAMLAELQPGMYGVGYVNHVNEGGFDVDYVDGAIPYLHPACMLCNIEVVRNWPMPTKHGAPMTMPMLALHNAGRHDMVRGIDWVREDFGGLGPRHFLRHDWQGTVKRSGSYNLDDWAQASREALELRLMVKSLLPPGAKTLVEIGANDGGLARLCKEADPTCRYVTVSDHPQHETGASNMADLVLRRPVDLLGDDFFRDQAGADCWILDQALERIAHPARLLERIRKAIAPGASVVAVVPNAQHWSVQAKLCAGDFRYDESHLMNLAHLRWFTRSTLFELFGKNGFQIIHGMPVIRAPLENQQLLAAFAQLAACVGADPQMAVNDAQAEYYVVKAVAV